MQSVNNFFCAADQIQQKIVYHDLDIFTLDKLSTPVDTNHTVGGSLCINTSLQSECTRSLHYETYDCDKRIGGFTNSWHYETETMRAF